MKNLSKAIAFIAVSLLSTSASMAQSGVVTTIAGGGSSYSDGVAATSAQFSRPTHVCQDISLNVYVMDEGIQKIRKIDHSTGLIQTIAGGGTSSADGIPATDASLSRVKGMFVDLVGNLYLSDTAGIRMVNGISGIISTVVGGGTSMADGIPATTASFRGGTAIYVDPTGNIYCDVYDSLIRKVDVGTGMIHTIAGGGTSTADGVFATIADLSGGVNSISVDGFGNVYYIPNSGDRIRKINYSTGLVSTVAGTGTYLYDGWAATACQLFSANSCSVDAAGNIFYSDLSRIRRVDVTSGILNSVGGIIAGGGSGYYEGGAALGNELHPNAMTMSFVDGNFYYTDNSGNYVRKFSFSPIVGATGTTADSFSIYINKLCSGPAITAMTHHFVAGSNLLTYFGDGSSITTTFLVGGTGYANAIHTYPSSGVYTIKHYLRYGTTVIDSYSYAYNYLYCNSIPVQFYFDNNSNCVKEGSEVFNSSPILVQVDSNDVHVDTISCTGGIYYNAFGAPGDIYKFRPFNLHSGSSISCPSTGIIPDTLSSSSYIESVKYVAMTCDSGAAFDLSIHSTVLTGRHSQIGHIYTGNLACPPTNATVTLHHNPKYAFLSADPSPTSTTSNSVTWEIAGLSTITTPVSIISYSLETPSSSWLVPGDTTVSYYTISPETGDDDTSNNSDGIIDTVRSSYDPNGMWVAPSGCITSNTDATQLKYTVQFENTGNDTAHNIFVMDTLSDGLDIHTFKMVMASNTMFVTKLTDAAGHNILKFDFPNINLLDTSHHGKCDGAFIYNIKTKAGLPYGTSIANRAGIYFDINPVVMTNVVDNNIGCPILTVDNAPMSKFDIFPNPANDLLNITTTAGSFNTYTITNSVSKTMISEKLTQAQTQVNIKSLPAGLYFVNLKGEQGSVVWKFVKL